jgi:hypothetical protein
MNLFAATKTGLDSRLRALRFYAKIRSAALSSAAAVLLDLSGF